MHWHTFILFTKEYFEFCKRLGVDYIHHQPSLDFKPSRNDKEFSDFVELYQKTFQQNLPKIWNPSLDERSSEGESSGADCGDCG